MIVFGEKDLDATLSVIHLSNYGMVRSLSACGKQPLSREIRFHAL